MRYAVMRTVRLLSVLLAALTTAAPSAGGDRDRFGDPLLDGAVARLGTVRHRVHIPDLGGAGPVVSPDGSWIAVGEGKKLRLVDAATGRTVAEQTWGERVWRIAIAPNGRTLAVA